MDARLAKLAALAQKIQVNQPRDGSTVNAGSIFEVEVAKPVSLTPLVLV